MERSNSRRERSCTSPIEQFLSVCGLGDGRGSGNLGNRHILVDPICGGNLPKNRNLRDGVCL